MQDNDLEINDVELLDDEENVEEETHDPAKAEDQSVKATAKADGDGIKKAPKRKGDKDTKMPMQKVGTKKEMVNAMAAKMNEMTEEEVEDLFDAMVEEFGEIEAPEPVELPEYDFSEEVEDLVATDPTLSEDFKEKASVIFEAAINSKLTQEIEKLEESYQTRLDEELEATRDDLVEKVDSYLNYVVEKWTEENELAIESGLRAEVAEEFMGKLKDIFVESYIEVPESKIDLVDELATTVEELEERLNDETATVLEMTKELETLKRAEVIRENSADLAETEVEKLNSLTEGLEFETEEAFSEKVKTVKETYFKKEGDSQTGDEVIEEDWTEEKSATGAMGSYLSALNTLDK